MALRWLPCLALALVAAFPAAARERAEPATQAARPCPTQGPGFIRIPGSDTCIRLGGRIVSGIEARIDRRAAVARPVTDGRFQIDARTQTDLGPVRTFVRIGSGRR
ncbi:porin [Methylobacterium iners]|uniref:Porin n=1 Tax=Methylobacterium iners TaxID=418707 RepID=A0ABQ4RSI5_9HYPH|nr:porin [Methylobacterium iners]GJD93118.1 hypothetical protein OCOJLMKI_0307 [Methylobacterium iners]